MKDNKQELSVEKMENVSGGGWEQVVPVIVDVTKSLIGSNDGDGDSKSENTATENYDQKNSNNSGAQQNTEKGDNINNGGMVVNKKK